MIKTLNRMGIKETYLNIIKITYDKPTAYYTESGKVESFPRRIRKKTRIPSLTTFIQHNTESLILWGLTGGSVIKNH